MADQAEHHKLCVPSQPLHLAPPFAASLLFLRSHRSVTPLRPWCDGATVPAPAGSCLWFSFLETAALLAAAHVEPRYLAPVAVRPMMVGIADLAWLAAAFAPRHSP